jgi:integrase
MPKVRKDNKGRNLRTGETQRSDGSYMFVYKLGTKKKYIYDTDLASLRAKEKQIAKDADDGIRTQEAMKLTLNDMFKVYMDNNIRLKPSTRANYEYLWDRYVKDEPFANEPLPNVRRSDVLGFYTKLLKHGFAINSLESINTIVHPAFELAVADDYIRKNPSKGIYTKLKTDGSAPKPKKRIALTKAQQKNFLQYIAKSPMYSHWLPVMVVLLGTGMRVAECTGLTKNDVDLENNTISVNHNLIYRVIDGKAGFHITTPKTASGTRTIPILYPQVAEQLRTLIEVMDTLYPEDLVMNGYHGFLFRNREGYFLSAHNINRAIQRISIAYNAEEMDQAELEDREPELLPHFSVHNMRHTFCTRLCESTNDIKFIQQVMGHADFSTTMDIYTHITQENMREKAEAIKGNLVLM